MNIDKATFKEFEAEFGNIFPYNEAKKTRNGYYPKWILMKALGLKLICRNLAGKWLEVFWISKSIQLARETRAMETSTTIGW